MFSLLIIGGTLVPTFILMVLFYRALKGYYCKRRQDSRSGNEDYCSDYDENGMQLISRSDLMNKKATCQNM